MPTCSVTFSPFMAVNAIPSLGVLKDHLYWASDQTVTDEQGQKVRLVMRHFLQPSDVPAGGGLPARTAGHLYGTYQDCTAAGSGDPDDPCPPTGACNFTDGDCCYETTEEFCFGEWKGLGTDCGNVEVCVQHVCCNIGQRTNCQIMPPSLCQIFGGVPLPNEEQCTPNLCDGACCIFGGFCVDDFSLDECRAINATTAMWARFMGPQSVCADFDCPEEGACCLLFLEGGCELLSPIECEALHRGVFRGLGTSCNTEGICGGACCHFDPAGGGDCFDVERAALCAGVDQTWLGPNTSCATHMGDCGICCLVTTLSGGEIFPPGEDPGNVPGGPNTGWRCDKTLGQQECIALGGTPFGPGSQCEQCDLVRRACCRPGPIIGPDPPTGDTDCFDTQICISVRTKQECTDLRGIFDAARDCDQAPCAFPNFTGACCCPPPGGPGPCVCIGEFIESDCVSSGAFCFWQGLGTACGEEGSTHPCFIDCATFGENCVGP